MAWAFAAVLLSSSLAHACPDAAKHWAALVREVQANPPQDMPKPRATSTGFDLVGRRDSVGELLLRVTTSTCASVGFGWQAEYVGGLHIPAAVHPVLMRNGARVAWQAQTDAERSELLRLMSAKAAAADDASVAGAVVRRRAAGAPLETVPGKLAPEGRVVIDGALFFGTRLSGMPPLTRIQFGPDGAAPFAGRVHGPPLWTGVYDAAAKRTVLVPTHPRALTSTAVAAPDERAIVLGGSANCDAHLVDLARLRLHPLPGRCAGSGEDADFAVLRGDATGRAAWLLSGEGAVVDYARLLRGPEGVTRHAPLAWGVAHKDPLVVMAALLLAPDRAAQDQARAALEALPGWETPSAPWVGVRVAAEKTRVVARETDGVDFERRRPYWLLGALGDRSYVLLARGTTPRATLALELEDSAGIVAMPRAAVYPSETVARLQQLHEALTLDEAYGSVLMRILVRRPLTGPERQKVCAAEARLLTGHAAWELTELIAADCLGWALSTGANLDGRVRSPGAICAEWKALCPRRASP